VAENFYHIPNDVIEICDRIKPDKGQPRVRAAFPSDLVHFVRQYDTNILMPYGRDMVVPQWDYYNPVYEVMEKPETIVSEDLLAATRETKCSYIILANDRKIDKDLTELGLKVLDTVGKYIIYVDPEILEN
jgi:rRNA-processing protein FCF1